MLTLLFILLKIEVVVLGAGLLVSLTVPVLLMLFGGAVLVTVLVVILIIILAIIIAIIFGIGPLIVYIILIAAIVKKIKGKAEEQKKQKK